MNRWDVIIIGAGNAAFCAAHAARENGGNSCFTAGVIRFAHDGVAGIPPKSVTGIMPSAKLGDGSNLALKLE